MTRTEELHRTTWRFNPANIKALRAL